MKRFIFVMFASVFLFSGIANANSIILYSEGVEHLIDSGNVERPRLNNYDEVVWTKNLGDATYGIFSSIDGLVSSGYVLRDPDINDDGEIIWRFGDGGRGENGIESSNQGRIFTNAGQDPYYDTQRINNNGEIIASRYGGDQVWSSIRGNLPTYGWNDRQTEVNDQGEVVSKVYYGPNGNIYDIYSTERGAITNDDIWQYNPDINNICEIVWDQNEEIWSDLRGKIGTGTNPAINDFGEIVWSYDGDIYSSVRGQITSDSANDLYPQINNQGGVAFLRYDRVTPVPVPTTMLLLGSGLIGLAGFRRKFRKK